MLELFFGFKPFFSCNFVGEQRRFQLPSFRRLYTDLT
jgi:hypothetical protein